MQFYSLGTPCRVPSSQISLKKQKLTTGHKERSPPLHRPKIFSNFFFTVRKVQTISLEKKKHWNIQMITFFPCTVIIFQDVQWFFFVQKIISYFMYTLFLTIKIRTQGNSDDLKCKKMANHESQHSS